jgi:DNA-binding MarR family transcriptional regulator
VDRCVRKGLAERFREGPDKRNVFIRLTQMGDAVVEKVALKNRHEILAALPAFLEFLETLR